MKEFNFDELIEFTKLENRRIARREGLVLSDKAAVTEGLAKLMEECGEFATEALIKLGLCRAEKQRENSAELADECADCIIVLLMLAERLNIDIKSALKNKSDKINKRYAEYGTK